MPIGPQEEKIHSQVLCIKEIIPPESTSERFFGKLFLFGISNVLAPLVRFAVT